ncbi:alternative ribosome rescue aminoacyl-tRNA hydrolase ArfB [Pinibacter sp. MAH-24]|uniref:Alternative ribosome rescue aminoacyl-tRNA hydrolase ArfB n=1 Tax=Pinibacter soli TaxID=3044211 RepID=A0ABT6RIW3_9BACT|nr:alternative ribosome rescue aminoacyl-tRNA hydrolase ArfB [Pinibacter soli]MDI3322396.1 alternative ribosome rescue aminoacyl-tRNA hydrolase ArfB [Pinibacter soli]
MKSSEMIDITQEIKFKTARSGGKGGQNVNKVETMVEGYFHVNNSALLTDDQKQLINLKLANKITGEGFLQTKSQTHRSQLQNKAAVIKKLHQMIAEAFKKEKKRVATKPSKTSQEKRVENKKKASQVKSGRKKISLSDF